ncbi:FmdB family zinc ribbon protein [Thioalkalivibrio sp. ALE31]|uniref:FmdB family zinc ribbon protein n=1 Tax=Thioalkalivibrio sp. ALE31 TaxID=1158182 RepID=UPI000477856C|nr:zinc ribbon domain-containing protein [Thioalkalivibrio sp. ALE31]
MPLYDYRCPNCGDFTEFGRMTESSSPQCCPECGTEAPRLISAPRLSLMDPSNRERWARNEQSRHAPKKVRRSSCGCSGTHTCGTQKAQETKSAETQHPPLKKQTKKTARPWMLGH